MSAPATKGEGLTYANVHDLPEGIVGMLHFGTLPDAAPAAEEGEVIVQFGTLPSVYVAADDTLTSLHHAAAGVFDLDVNAKPFKPGNITTVQMQLPKPKAKRKAKPKSLPKPRHTVRTVPHRGVPGSLIGKGGRLVKALEARHGVVITLVGDEFLVQAVDTSRVEAAAAACEALLAKAQQAAEEVRVWRMSQADARTELSLHKEAQGLKKKLHRVQHLQRQPQATLEANQVCLLEPAYAEELGAKLEAVKGKLVTSESIVFTLKAKVLRSKH